MKGRLLTIAFCTDLLALRFFLAMAAVITGLGFLWPSEIFPDVSNLSNTCDLSRMAYVFMAVMAPEWVWGAAFVSQGCVTLWSLMHNYQTRTLLWFDAAFGCFMWTVSMLSCYAAYWAGIDHLLDYSMPAILGIGIAAAIASWWVLVRYGVEDHNSCKK